jgi:hypothetical protein
LACRANRDRRAPPRRLAPRLGRRGYTLMVPLNRYTLTPLRPL